MWYKYSMIQDDIIKNFENCIKNIPLIQDPKERMKAILDMEIDIYKLDLSDEEKREVRSIFYPILNDLYKEADKQLRLETGEPDLDFNDIYTFPEWIQWKEQNKGLGEYDLPYLLKSIEDNYSIYNNKVYYNKRYSNFYMKPVPEEESKFVLSLRESLKSKSFDALGVNRENLLDLEKWDVEVFETEEGHVLKLTKTIIWMPNNDPDAEGTIITFIASPKGISIYAEVSDPPPLSFQKEELRKFIYDVQNNMPKNWNKQIIYAEGADFESILSGNLEKDIKVYRMMSDEEYNKWRAGEIIPPGKYFATKRQFAQGTDFASDGFREIFQFNVNRSLMSGMDENVLINDVPLLLQGRKLIPLDSPL